MRDNPGDRRAVVVQPDPANDYANQAAKANPILIDGAAVALMLTALAGTTRMFLPSLAEAFKSRQSAKAQAEAELRTAEIAQDNANQDAMHKLIARNVEASERRESELIEAIVGRIGTTLDKVAETMVKLGDQSSAMAQTQGEISKALAEISKTQTEMAAAQQRTLEILSTVESRLEVRKPRPTKRPSD